MAKAWWIEAEGRVWGPYPQDRLAAFVAEQRLVQDTLVGPGPDGPFQPASREPKLAELFSEPVLPAPRDRALLVVADLQATSSESLEAALRVHGAIVRVRPGLWLVRVRSSAAGLRNTLSRRLQPADMLMVVEAESAGVAWFNLAGETDRALRRLWTPGGPSEG